MLNRYIYAGVISRLQRLCLQAEVLVVIEVEAEHAVLDAPGQCVKHGRALLTSVASLLSLHICNVNKSAKK